MREGLHTLKIAMMHLKDLYQPVLRKLGAWVDGFMDMLPNAAVAFFVLVAFWWLSKLAAKVGERTLRRANTHKAALSLVSTFIRVGVLIAGAMVALGVLHLDKALASILAGAGIVGLALGFAFQDLAANLISGVGLAINQDLPFRIGDIVETNDSLGIVRHINLRTSILESLDGKTIVIPNKHIYQNKVVNYSLQGKLRVEISCGISYGDDLGKVKQVVLAVLEKLEMRDSSRPVDFFYQGFGDSSINFVGRFWVQYENHADYLAAQSEAVLRIKKAFDDNDIVIPFPIRTLDFGIRGGERLSQVLAEYKD